MSWLDQVQGFWLLAGDSNIRRSPKVPLRQCLDTVFNRSDRIRVDVLILTWSVGNEDLVSDSNTVLTLNLVKEALLPVGGLSGGQESNSHPFASTTLGSASKDPVPDLFSAGAEMMQDNPASVKAKYI